MSGNLAIRPDDGRHENGRRRLTEDDIRAIRGHYAAGLTTREVAIAFGIHHSRVAQLIGDMPRHTNRGPRRDR